MIDIVVKTRPHFLLRLSKERPNHYYWLYLTKISFFDSIFLINSDDLKEKYHHIVHSSWIVLT